MGRVEDGIGEPAIDAARPLAQVELRKEGVLDCFLGRQDGTDLIGCVGSDATEGLQFVEASSELQPGRVRQIECFLQGNRVPTPCGYQTQPQWRIVLQPPLVCHLLEQHEVFEREIVCIIDNEEFGAVLVQVSHEFWLARAPMSSDRQAQRCQQLVA